MALKSATSPQLISTCISFAEEERLSASDELTKLQELFRAAPEEEEELKVDLNFSQQAEGTIVFGEDHKKPLTMPYLLLDPRWYKQTTEDERVQQGEEPLHEPLKGPPKEY